LPRFFLPAVLATAALGLGATASAQLPPQLPATFFGSVSIDGRPPADGTEVRAFIDGVDCTQAPNSERTGSVLVSGVANYVVTVVHETQRPGCGREGRLVNFTIAGRPAGQAATWRTGPQRLDLNTGSGAPVPLPTSTPTPLPATATVLAATALPATSTARAAFTPGSPGPIPTDNVDPSRLFAQGSGAATPGTGGSDGSGSGGSILGIVIAVLGGLALIGAGAGAVLSRKGLPGRKRETRDGRRET
jgi:hypothetical protein